MMADWKVIDEIVDEFGGLNSGDRARMKNVLRLLGPEQGAEEPEKQGDKIEAGTVVSWRGCVPNCRVWAIMDHHVWLVSDRTERSGGFIGQIKECQLTTPAVVEINDTVQYDGGLPAQVAGIDSDGAVRVQYAHGGVATWPRDKITILLKAPKGEKP